MSLEFRSKAYLLQIKEAVTLIEILDKQRDLLLEWRMVIIDMLSRKLSGADEDGSEADGQEYARALDTQGEVEQYMKAYGWFRMNPQKSSI